MSARDTTREAHVAQLAALRAAGPEARVELAFQMSEQAREISLMGIRSRNPQLSESDARSRLLRHILGEQLHRAAYGDSTA